MGLKGYLHLILLEKEVILSVRQHFPRLKKYICLFWQLEVPPTVIGC